MIKNISYPKYIIGAFALATALFIFSPSLAKAEFNPNHIISDQEILDELDMTLEEIQNLLVSQGGALASYTVIDPDNNSMTAAQAIYSRAVTNHVNPKFIIVLLQKEQSLIESKTLSQRQLDWATGYGCPDSSGCNERWRGFWKQINSASLQFRDYMDNPHLYRYKAGQTYTVSNTGKPDMIITPVNQATAALYNYTPHVYNGNYNFWKIWQRYFTRSYLNGSLLQVAGEPGVWLIENGFKRPFLTRSALTSRFDPARIQIISKTDLDKYPTGEGIRFAQYSIVRIPNGRIYLLVNNEKRRFINPEAFRQMGFNPEEIIHIAEEELIGYTEGVPITPTSTYPTGALLQDKITGGVYWVDASVKYPIWDKVLLSTKFSTRKIIATSPTDLAAYTTGSPVTLEDGDIVKTADSPAVYIIENSLKRPVMSAEAFLELNYKWENIITVSTKLLSLHNDGEAIIKD